MCQWVLAHLCGRVYVVGMTITIQHEDDGSYIAFMTDDDEKGIALPMKRELCGRCDGRGVHDHPAFGNGLTAADFDEDPDFRSDYLSGAYDVPCGECGGRRVVEVVDVDRLAPDVRAAFDADQEERAQWHAEEAAHARACANGYGW